MAGAALALIYNHRYDANIPKLDAVYGGRFSRILHLVPFYSGDLPHVVPVYENSHRFQGYVPQSLARLKELGADHIVFAADDLLLNPGFNESNICELLEIPADYSYIPACQLADLTNYWVHAEKSLTFPIVSEGAEGSACLPPFENAFLMLARHFKSFRVDVPLEAVFDSDEYKDKFDERIPLPYPLVMGYSDFFVVSANTLNLFAHYCGIFSAMNLFVELALPTALLFSSSKVKKALPPQRGELRMWSEDDVNSFSKLYGRKLGELLAGFPDYAYVHPVKLSQWN